MCVSGNYKDLLVRNIIPNIPVYFVEYPDIFGRYLEIINNFPAMNEISNAGIIPISVVLYVRGKIQESYDH